MDNYFARLNQLDVSKHIEKKGQFSYLSWPYAVAQLRLADPAATWEVKRFDGLPYLKTECGFFVEVAVTVDGVTLSQIHPVLDHRNQPISSPNSFHINTSIQRCLVKAIALHGLGLYVYAGEDLPEAVNGHGDAAGRGDHGFRQQDMDEGTATPEGRAAALEAAVAANHDSILCIKEGIAEGNLSKAAEAWYELSEDTMRALWVAPSRNVDGKRVVVANAPFTTEERAIMKTPEFRMAHTGVAAK